MSTAGSRPRILLIGSGGQVGWELARSLQPLGELTSTMRSGPAGSIGPQRSLDLTAADAVRACVREVRPDLIVNAAAYTAVDRAESEPELAWAINAAAPGVLAEEARRLGTALVHYSTDYVFDGSGTRPWREDDPTGPVNAYGHSKLAGEEAIRAAGAKHLILRVSWVYGVHGANFPKTMLRLGADRPELSVVDDQVGAPTSARVIADTTAAVLSQARGDFAGLLAERGGTVHLACAGQTSWHAFATEVIRQSRELGASLAVQTLRPIPTADYRTPAVRPLNSRMDCGRLTERFALSAPPWEFALSVMLQSLFAADRPACVRDAAPDRPGRAA